MFQDNIKYLLLKIKGVVETISAIYGEGNANVKQSVFKK